MYYVYDLRRNGITLYTGITAELGRSVSRHLSAGRQFDSLHIIESTPALESAKSAARQRRYLRDPMRATGF